MNLTKHHLASLTLLGPYLLSPLSALFLTLAISFKDAIKALLHDSSARSAQATSARIRPSAAKRLTNERLTHERLTHERLTKLTRLTRLTRAQIVSLRLVSLAVLTGLGWAVFNMVEIRSATQLVSSSGSDLLLPGDVAPNALQAVGGMETAPEVAMDRASHTVTATTNAQSSAAQSSAPEPSAEALSFHLPSFELHTAQSVAKADDGARVSGNRIQLNSQAIAGRWQQRNGRIGIASSALTGVLGVELLNTQDPSVQPVRWFSATGDDILTLPAWWDATERYIDIADLVARSRWSQQVVGSTLQLNMPASQVNGIRQGRQTWGDRIVVDLSAPATWQLEDADTYTVTINGTITPQMVRSFRAASSTLITQLHVAPLSGRTVLKIKTREGAQPQIWSTGNPARIVIDIRRDAMIERDVAWAPGLRWRQQYVSVGSHRFPVYMFIARPNPATLALRPIHARAGSAIGIEPLVTQAQRQQVAGAVNAGFFNRNNQLPLGAVRNNGQWVSGPILGRGAMAWNEQGDLFMDRFVLSEVVRTQSGAALPVLALNSGYVQAGIGRYTSGWGTTYAPIVDNEVVVAVQGDRILSRQTLGKAGSGSVAIPANGYLLTLRSNNSAADKFVPGEQITVESQSQPALFDQYPNVMGGGPLLIRDRNIVLNPQLEGFSTNFIQGVAPRTAVGKTADGTWIIATMHDRVGGRGPTLSETAQIMQQLGAVDALNLDGGSSSSLYLGGQLLNRSPRTAARVNNGIGLFVTGGE